MIRIELDEEDVIAGLTRLSARLADLSPLMAAIGDALAESTEKRFPQGVAPDGTAWAPKSETTRARQHTGDFRPLFGDSGSLHSEIVWQAGPKSVEIGSSLIYAAVQQFGAAKGAFGNMANGSPIPWGNIPARPYLGISEDDRANIFDIINEYLAAVPDGD